MGKKRSVTWRGKKECSRGISRSARFMNISEALKSCCFWGGYFKGRQKKKFLSFLSRHHLKGHKASRLMFLPFSQLFNQFQYSLNEYIYGALPL